MFLAGVGLDVQVMNVNSYKERCILLSFTFYNLLGGAIWKRVNGLQES